MNLLRPMSRYFSPREQPCLASVEQVQRNQHPASFSPEAGVAMPLALIGLVLISLMVTGALVTSSTEVGISGVHQDGSRDLYLAEAQLERYVAENVGAGTFIVSPGGEGAVYHPTSAAKPVRVTVAELDSVAPQIVGTDTIAGHITYAVTSEPLRSATQEEGRAVVALLRSKTYPGAPNDAELDSNIQGALTSTSKKVQIGGSSFISGVQDSTLCAATDSLYDGTSNAESNAVILAASGQDVKIDEKSIDGGLDKVHKTAHTREELAAYVLGGVSPYKVARNAQIKFGFDGESKWDKSFEPNSDLFEQSNRLNWGCPRKMLERYNEAPCAADDTTYFPTVGINGNVELTGDHGQGTLIVLGDLDIRGKFFYSGIVIVTGKTFVRGSGKEARIDGALIALGDVYLEPDDSTDGGTGDDGEDTTVLGNAKVVYNTCSITRAQQAYNDALAPNPAVETFPEPTFGWFEVVR